MKRNIWVIGERNVSGKYNRIINFGEFSAVDSEIEKCYSFGEVDLENCSVKKLHAFGEANSTNCNFSNVYVAGEINLKGPAKADVFSADIINADYLECNILRNSSSANGRKFSHTSICDNSLSGTFKAKTFENICDFELNCDFGFSNIISKNNLTYSGTLECERLYSFGILNTGEINADYVYIKPYSYSQINSITGSEIIILPSFTADKTFKSISKSADIIKYINTAAVNSSIMNVQVIEGDKIHTEDLKAESIRGINVEIGDLCIIDHVEYSESIKISPKSIVNEVVKL